MIVIVSRIKRLILWIQDLYRLDKTIVLALVALCIINLLVQFSANDRSMSKLISDASYLAGSFVILFIIANLNICRIKNSAPLLYIISLALLVAVIFIGIKIHGAKRWLNLGIRFQPSELAKLSVPLMLAYYFDLIKHKFGVITRIHFIIGFILVLIPFALIIKQPDLGTGILVFCAGFFVLFFAGLSWRIMLICLFIFLISTPVIWHFLHDYQQHRILTLINPQSDPLGKGYHIIQGIIAIGSGGFFGKGYLHGTQIHLDFIPEKNTDFVMCVLAEEFGFIGVAVVLLLYLILVLRGLYIMEHAQSLFGQLIAGSISLSLLLYVTVNAGMVAGIFPVVGVPLPLISYGGTATIVLMIGFAILLAIAKNNKYTD